MKFLPYIFLALIFSLNARAEFDPTQILFDTFSGDCSTSSDLTRKAQSQASLLTNIAKGFRDDPACKVLAPGLDALAASLSAQDSYYASGQAQNELNKDLMIKLQIGLASEKALPLADQNPDFITNAQAKIASLQIEIAQGEAGANMDKRRDRLAMVENARTSANSLAQSLANNRACMVAHPSVFGQVLGSVMRVASGIFPGLIGAGISSAASVVDTLVTTSYDKKMTGFVTKMRSEALSQAAGCTLEGLATTYCQGRDVEAIIQEFKRQENDVSSCSAGVVGARIAGQEINSLMDFLQKVSLTEGRASDKLTAKTLTSDRDVLETALLAKVEAARLAVRKGENKTAVIDSLLDDLASSVATGSGRIPSTASLASIPFSPNEYAASYGGNLNFVKFNSSIMFVNPKNCGVWRYLYTGGKKGSKADGDDTGDFNSTGSGNTSKDSCLAAFKKAGFAEPTIDDLEFAAKAYSQNLDSFVLTKLNTIQATDPNTVLSSADKKTGRRMTPLQVMAGIDGYLRATKADLNLTVPADRYLSAAIDPVLDKVVQAREIYESTSYTDPKEKAMKIYEIFGKEDFSLYSVQFYEVVKNDMERRRSQNKSEYAQMLFALSGTESASVMQKFIGFTEHDTAGSYAARASAENSLKQFAKLFSEPMNASLRELGSKNDKVAKQMLGLNCMRTLLVPNPEESIPAMTQVCGGTSYKGDTLKPLAFNDFVRKPFSQRVCSIYDYFRKAELASRIETNGNDGRKRSDPRPSPATPAPAKPAPAARPAAPVAR